ncbi:hypothetical protein CmeUKMEL1_04195 [Cryptosporidium meleagridis]|uniref:Uncharacterized protein n=1 Tax=Cryptosporidium meleagridis TaxID=93969 RepID=A0A2P4YY99_9CRYT|nr:hypothetical protein CmeUKMEL1_04195 [Cryptosporidium meleagridis]
MHQKGFIYLLNLVYITSIFIVCLSLINSVDTKTLLKINADKTNKNAISHFQRTPRSRNSKAPIEFINKNKAYIVQNLSNYPGKINDTPVNFRKDAPTFYGNIYLRNNEYDNKLNSQYYKENISSGANQVDYYSFLGGRYNLLNALSSDQIEVFHPEKSEESKTKYKWMNDKYLGSNKYTSFYPNDNYQQIYYLLNKALSVSLPKNTTLDNEFQEFVTSNIGKSNRTQFIDNNITGLYQNNSFSRYLGFGNRRSLKDEISKNKISQKLQVKNITLSNSDPVNLIQEMDNSNPNIKWTQDVLAEIPSSIPENMVNFEYQHINEQDTNELEGKEGTLLKEFVKLAVDFSFLSGSSLNGAVCMFKAVLPLMKIRWKTLNLINTSKMDTIVKIMLGIPFFKYFEEKESMISSCINMFFSMDIDSGEGLCLNKSGYEGSIMGISVADFIVKQYQGNKIKLNKEKETKRESNKFKPYDSANLLEMIYDDICNYFYECMDEDISDEVNEYLFQNSHIFGVMENQKINFFKSNHTALFPDTSEKKSSVDALPSDWFLAALQHLSQMNAELPELEFPGLNIRDIGRLYFYSGRLGVQLPIRLALKMIYELSVFANHSSLLRRAFCTESLMKIINFKIANVLCKISFSPIPLKFDSNELYISLKNILKMISFTPVSWKKRPDPICSEAEIVSEKYPDSISPPDFIQYYAVRDKWSLYRSLAIQLYGSLSVEDGGTTLSIVSMLHSLIIGYIKLNWDEFRELYFNIGIIDPERYYSLLLSQRRGPGLIELIAFSQIYNFKVMIYKKIKRNSKREVHFELDKEITGIVKQFSNEYYHSDETYNILSCKVVRLLLERELPPTFYQGVFKTNISDFNETIYENVKDGSNWIWDAIIPVYDSITNKKILSNGIGVQIKYKSIIKEQIDEEYEIFDRKNEENDTFPLFKIIQDETKHYIDTSNWRKPFNNSYGQILSSGSKTINQGVTLNDKQSEFRNINKVNNSTFQLDNEHKSFLEKYYQYYIIIQPLISFHQAGVYESKMFINKVFKFSPQINWEDLPKRLDLEYLQSIIYVGDIYKERKNLEIDTWKPDEQKNNIINIFPENKLNTETDQENSELFEQITKKENVTLTKNENKTTADEVFMENSTKFNGYTNLDSESRAEIIKTRKSEKEYGYPNITLISQLKEQKDQTQTESLSEFESELEYIIIPTAKPWNNYVSLPKVGVMNNEPEFSFIPLKVGPLLPNKAKENSVFKLDMEILFNMAREFWMLPLNISSRAIYCFAKNISPFLNNPSPIYIPQMFIYDRIISTVISLLPVVDNSMNNIRPIEFVITVCEMALLDPIDLDPFLKISRNNINSSAEINDIPNELKRIFGQMPAIKNICALVANCLHLSNYGNEYKNLVNKASKSELFNKFTPSSEQLILIQKLVPRFPEVVVIIRNLLRMIHFIGRKGISLDKDALYQIAKELSITFHSISPYLWKLQIDLKELYEMEDKPTFGLREGRRMKKNYFAPIYEEAYWRQYDKELLLFTCASILTSRSILTYVTAIVVCHYSFLRIPLSKKILSTIPNPKDFENDEKLATETIFFFLRDFIRNPIELLKSKEYNEDPMATFAKIYSKWQEQNNHKLGIDQEKIKKEIFSTKFNLFMFMTYDKYIDLLLENGQELENAEVKFERKNQEIDSFYKLDRKSYSSKENLYNSHQSGKNGFFKEKIYNEEKFSSFWGYKPNPYKKDLRKSNMGSNIDDIFESLSLLLYSTNSYKELIKTTFTSSLSLINKICELERDIIRNFKSNNAYIHVEGVDQEIVLFVFSICNKMKSSRERMRHKMQCARNPENCKPENIDQDYEMQHLEIFEVMQFIYKIPIMVFEMNQEQTIIRDTELNRRIYSLNDTNKLLSSIRIAKIFDSNSKSFKYMPMIPKITVCDFEDLKNGVGPIPIEAILKGMNSMLKSTSNREIFKFRKRTAFDDASDNYFKRKQISVPFPCANYPRNLQSSTDLVPILRRYIPYVPGDVEGKSLLQFIKISTAVIDLRRRPIKELPDRRMEKTFRSILLDDKNLNGSREYLMKIYGLDINEIIKKNHSFEKRLIDIKNDETDLNMFYDLYINDKKSINEYNQYKFLIEYFNIVRDRKISPDVIHSFIDLEESRKRGEKQSRIASVGERMNGMLKYAALSIFSEFYYYWSKFKYNIRKFSYENPIKVEIIPSDEVKEERLKNKQISLYIEDKLDEIKLNRNHD